MHLTITPKILLEEFLGIRYTKVVTEELSKIADLSTRQVSTYVKRGEFSPGITHKLVHYFRDQGFSIPDEIFDRRFEIPISWKTFLEENQKKEDSFLPRTFRLIQEFADKDIEFIKQVQPLPLEGRFSAYREYLTNEIVPLYCLDPSRTATMVRISKDEKELKQPLLQIFLESILYLLSFAELEYVTSYLQGNDSLLSKVLPEKNQNGTVSSPSMRFFQEWMKTLEMDKDAMIQEMIDHFGETDVSGFSSEDDEAETLSREGLRKSLSRYLKKGEIPSWATIEKFAKGLHWRAMDIQKRNDDHDSYCQGMKDLYGGVRVLDKLYRELCKVLPEKEVLAIMSTYPAHYAMHQAALKEEAGQMPAS